jgi:hypothetical protein
MSGRFVHSVSAHTLPLYSRAIPKENILLINQFRENLLLGPQANDNVALMSQFNCNIEKILQL